MSVFRATAASLAGLAAIASAAAWWATRPPPLEPLAPLEVRWTPENPRQGRLFRIRVATTPGVALSSVGGEAAGEALHFDSVGVALESLAAIPIDATDSVSARVTVVYADGRVQGDTLRIPVGGVEYESERLTVAPRFGSAPSAEDQARLERDRAMARRVAREARAAPRLWGSTVVSPRDDRTTSPFGTSRVFNGQVASRHMGLDLAADRGDTILAAATGVVALVDEFLLAGNVVYLNHGGGLQTGYFHLSDALVAAGDTVVAGTPIARAGATGRVTGPHLHWIVRYGSVSVDPSSLLEIAR